MTQQHHQQFSKLFRDMGKTVLGLSEHVPDEHLIHVKKLQKGLQDVADLHDEIAEGMDSSNTAPHWGSNPADPQQPHGSSPVATFRVAKCEFSQMESGSFPEAL
jgi:arginine deiminase